MSQVEAIRRTIKARLIEKGFSLRSWEHSEGYSDGFARKTISRFAGNPKRPGQGSKTLEVIAKLEEVTGIKICG